MKRIEVIIIISELAVDRNRIANTHMHLSISRNAGAKKRPLVVGWMIRRRVMQLEGRTTASYKKKYCEKLSRIPVFRVVRSKVHSILIHSGEGGLAKSTKPVI